MSAITCYSSRNCHGNLVENDTASAGKSGCCINGRVLSFKDGSNGICQECFSMYFSLIAIADLGGSHLEIQKYSRTAITVNKISFNGQNYSVCK